MSEHQSNPNSPHDEAAHRHTRRGREVLGMPLYSVTEGKHLGEINGLLVSRADCSVPLLRIHKLGMSGLSYVPFAAMQTIGEDIALVGTESAVLKEISAQEAAMLETDLPGRPVITQSGERVGRNMGFGLDTETGHIVFLRVQADSGFLGKLVALVRDTTMEVPVVLIVSFGPDAVIVQDAVKSLVRTESPGETEPEPTRPTA